MAKIESSCFDNGEYDEGWLPDFNGTVTLTFDDGAIYEYYRVPYLRYRALIRAASPGTYFNKQFRGRFKYKRLK